MVTICSHGKIWGSFASVTTYKAESIYNSGFALTRYISEKYGEDKLKEITVNLGDLTRLNSEGAFEKAIGKSGSKLYDEWKAFLKQDYKTRVEPINQLEVQGKLIADVGFANYYPQFSPDGKKITYLSNKTYDYGSTSMFIHNVNSKSDDEMLIASVSGAYNWSPDGKKIIFSRRNKPNIHDAVVFDLFEYDISSETETQLTSGLRAHAPAYSGDGKRICFVRNSDGTQNLFIAPAPNGKKLNKSEIKQLTSFTNGEQIYAPKWSPVHNNIVFDYSKEGSRQIAEINVDSKEILFMFNDPAADFRSPVYTKNGESIIFASDITGIYNIYKYDLIKKCPHVKRKQHCIYAAAYKCFRGRFYAFC